MSIACFHCGLETAPAPFYLDIRGERQAFCCLGCQAVAQMIGESGLSDFYRFRDGLNARAQTPDEDYTAFDLEQVQEDFVVTQDANSRNAHLFVPDIHCAACVWLIESVLAGCEGVESVRVSAASQSASVTFNPSKILLSRIFSALAAVGYPPQPLLAENRAANWQKQRKTDLMRLGVAGFGMMQAGMVAIGLHAGGIQGIEYNWQQMLRLVSLFLTLPVIAYSAVPFFRSALRVVLRGRLNMDVPVAIALILAFSASVLATVRGTGEVYFDSVAMFTFFLLLGRYLEKRARWRNLRARLKRLQLLPQTVTRIEQGKRSSAALKQVSVGEQVWLAPGAVIACDGKVLDGKSEVNEAVVTGEAAPVTKGPGDLVIAGSLNGSTALTVEVTAIGSTTKLAAIERLVDEAQVQKPSQVSFADSIIARFVGTVLLVAVSVGGFWLWYEPSRALWVVLSVLVVTCPCALGLATPTVLTAAINRLRERGVLVTGADALEAVGALSDVWFDKTGTLTEGVFRVVTLQPLDACSRERMLAIIAALEEGSSHPIAAAFAPYRDTLTVRGRETLVGAGVSGEVDGETYRFGKPEFALPTSQVHYPAEGLWLLLANSTAALGWVKLEDSLRPEAKQVVSALAQRGLKTAILSGDREVNVRDIARSLGIEQWRGALTPAEKLKALRERQSGGGRVMMVGDGINDVPVLALADVALAMGSATAFARNRADCVLLGDDLTGIARVLTVAAEVKVVIRQNLCWALGYNLVALPSAAAGMIPPWAAALGMSASSLVVVLNALRVGRQSAIVTPRREVSGP